MGYIVKHQYDALFSEQDIKNFLGENILLDIHSKCVWFYARKRKNIDIYLYSYRKSLEYAEIPYEENLVFKKQDYKGWLFYAEYKNRAMKHKDVAHSPQRNISVLQHTNGNVVAVFPEQRNTDGTMTSISTLMYFPSSNDERLVWGSISHSYLQDYCKRISLEQALKLHPNMFLQGYFDVEESTVS